MARREAFDINQHSRLSKQESERSLRFLSVLFGGRSLEAGDGILERLHFREGDKECQRRFRTLILAHPVHVQSVATAPCA